MRLIIFVVLFGLSCCAFAFSQEVTKIQEFEDLACDEYLARMDNVIVLAQNNPTSKIYVFVYEGKEKRFNISKNEWVSIFPAANTAKVKTDSIKKYISIVKKYSLENFTFIESGFRENLTVEFWMVPAGATPPEVSPTLTKIRHRKGKASGFCLWCCG